MPPGSSAVAFPLVRLYAESGPVEPFQRTSRTSPPGGATLNGAQVLGPHGAADATPTRSVTSASTPVRGMSSSFRMATSSPLRRDDYTAAAGMVPTPPGDL